MLPRSLKNRARVTRSYLLRRPSLGAFPLEIQIGITNYCNLDCAFCPQGQSERPRGFMALDLFDSLVEQAAMYVDTVDLSFDGEPFLHPKWAECVQACHRHGVRAMLETNALLMKEALAREVLEVGVDSITFSIDAASPEMYKKLKPRGDYARVVRNVEGFLRLARTRKRRPYIQLQFVSTPENAHEAPAFLRQWRGKGADVVHIKPMLNFGGSVGQTPNGKKHRPCLFLWSCLSIHWDGSVPLCCQEIEGKTQMGDATAQSLETIANNSAFEAVRRLHASGRHREHPVCRGCDVPSVPRPFVAGAVLVGDLTRRRLINLMDRIGVPL